VFSLDFTAKYNNWNVVDPVSNMNYIIIIYLNNFFFSKILTCSLKVELFTCPAEKKEATPKLKMPYFLSTEAKGIYIMHMVLLEL